MATSTPPTPSAIIFNINALSWKFTYPGGVGYTGCHAYADFIIRTITPRLQQGAWQVEESDLTRADCAALDGGIEPWYSPTEADDLAAFVTARNSQTRGVADVGWVRYAASNWVTVGLKDKFIAVWYVGEVLEHIADLVIAEGRAGGVVEKNE